MFRYHRKATAMSNRPERSQADRILEHLEVLETITPMEALREYGCFRLGARIHDLKAKGHVITTEIIEVKDGKRVARYRLATMPKAAAA